MAAEAGGGRRLRVCDLCQGVDDHPRHVQKVDGKGRERHMDCCAAAGCEKCQATEAEHGGLRGQELIDRLAELRGES